MNNNAQLNLYLLVEKKQTKKTRKEKENCPQKNQKSNKDIRIEKKKLGEGASTDRDRIAITLVGQ